MQTRDVQGGNDAETTQGRKPLRAPWKLCCKFSIAAFAALRSQKELFIFLYHIYIVVCRPLLQYAAIEEPRVVLDFHGLRTEQGAIEHLQNSWELIQPVHIWRPGSETRCGGMFKAPAAPGPMGTAEYG